MHVKSTCYCVQSLTTTYFMIAQSNFLLFQLLPAERDAHKKKKKLEVFYKNKNTNKPMLIAKGKNLKP